MDKYKNYVLFCNQKVIYEIKVFNCIFTPFKILMTVLKIPVKMVEHVRMKSATTRVLVYRDTLAITVQ